MYPENDPIAHLMWWVDVLGVLDTTRYDPDEAMYGTEPIPSGRPGYFDANTEGSQPAPPGSPGLFVFNIDAHTGYVWFRSSSIFEVAEPTAVAPQPADVPTLAVYPNPFNPSATIRFHVDAPGPVSLRVYDVTGTLVRSILVGSHSALGTHSVAWDGTDDRGRHVATGVYLVRLETPTQTVTQRATLLR